MAPISRVGASKVPGRFNLGCHQSLALRATPGEDDRGQAVNADKMTQDETEVPRNHPPGIDLSALP
jgi:hypothetical protein